ncbi:MAG: SigB/SigF/SigG family RNA polymerase sigma factor [Clostridia bacterium]|nr:SigB/SigF/SigG family RNA polymerase sigma factor [Clostridia bacterium]
MQTKKYNENIESLIEKAKNGDLNARNIIVEENIGLVRSVLKRFSGRGHETEDLFQIGCIGLIKAIEKFDPGFEVKFSTYAVPMIIGEIKRFIRDDGIIKVSRSLKELALKAMSLQEIIRREQNKEPTVRELAEKLGVGTEELATALEAGIKPESLYAEPKDEGKEGKALIDRLESSRDCEKEIVNRILVQELLEDFDEREKKIIVFRYFKQKTQAQIAKQLGISQVQVSRIEKKVLTLMREKMKRDG